MAKVGKQYKGCKHCEGKGYIQQALVANINCKTCTRGEHRKAPQGMVIVNSDEANLIK